jgi:oxygen-independent coproporphyrinogen III oxidase
LYSYIHIPFCESKCKYCRFASIGKSNDILIKKYISHLVNDIKNFKTDFLNKSVLNWLKTIYFWGWTPSILNEDYLKEILNELKNKFKFARNIEISLETTPWNVNIENIKSWETLWINRISIGVQTLNNEALKEIGRDDKWSIINALNNLKYSSIKNISVDFIIWLPYVKEWEILRNIKYILKSFPFIKHVSVYMLEDYYKINEENSIYEKIKYPNSWHNIWIEEDLYLKEYLSIRKFLEKNWYHFYELSNSSKKWFECKHNKSYWNHSNNVWFWLWSHSFINKKRYAYKEDFLDYFKWKLEYEEILTDNDIFLEKVLFWLRTNWISKSIQNKLNINKISLLLKSWFLKKNNEKIVLWNKWFSILDYIIKEII